mgnify:CR=1 FL=1
MEIRQLLYFTTVVEEGTVLAAAKRLNMTQPPLSAQIHMLENELGCRLFERQGRRLCLTEAGRSFYQRAQAILGLCGAAQEEMAQYRNGTMGTLRLGVVSSVGGPAFLKWICGFHNRHPAVRYALFSGNTYQLLEQLRAGQLDIALIRTPFSVPDMEVLRLRREALLAVGTHTYFPHPGGTVVLSELAELPLILYRRWEAVLCSRFAAAGCTPHILCRNDDAHMTLSLACSGLGVGILPASALSAQDRMHMEIRTIADPGLSSEIAVVCRKAAFLPHCAQLCWEELASANPEHTL